MAEINSYSDVVSQPAYHKHTNFYPIHEGLEELRSVKPVFILETDLFGNTELQQKDFLQHEEVYKSIGSEVPRFQMKGLQRVKGMWRIYLAQELARDHLLTRGVSIRNKLLTVYDKNPRIPVAEQRPEYLRIRVSNIPLSAEDGMIFSFFQSNGVVVTSYFRERVRINGEMTDCQSGDRIFFVEPLEGTLPRFTRISKYNAKIYYKGQIYINAHITCQKCLKKGHKQDKCQNDWVCNECGKEGHKAKECQTPSKPAPDNDTPSKTASDNEANKTDDQSDSSESESGEETDIGDHVDHSETPPSQSILLPTEAITATTTAISKVVTEIDPDSQEKKTRKKKNKDKTKNKPKVESKGPIDKFIVNPESTTPVQKQGKRPATTPTDEYHKRQTDSSKSSKT
ncbi:unnamed protein product [Mytilus edulis]|uniref:CCHC-type domain-containing protein n=1 Tax=Mytilus edulis TaxID=6550 RepID=A0A8S3V6E1_MYTED|nr:unnamed protein product [Mytilus edulis]